MARIRDDAGEVVLTYRSFASAIAIVASLVASIVVVTGFAAALFLVAEHHVPTGAIALLLAIAFAFLILALVPPVTVTLFDAAQPALTIAQRSRSPFPRASFAVVTPDGRAVAELQKSFFARFGRNRWTVRDSAGREIGAAVEESLGRSLLRKLLGKFSRRFEADVMITTWGKRAAVIVRRQTRRGEVDVLECTSDIDRRIAVALALLILGSEP